MNATTFLFGFSWAKDGDPSLVDQRYISSAATASVLRIVNFRAGPRDRFYGCTITISLAGQTTPRSFSAEGAVLLESKSALKHSFFTT